MELSHYIVDDICELRAWGPASVPDILAYAKILGADPAFDPQMDCLIDARDVAGVLSVSELRTLASGLERGWACGGRRAVLVSTGLAFGLLRMFGVFAESMGLCYRAFRSEEEAREWLATSDRATRQRSLA